MKLTAENLKRAPNVYIRGKTGLEVRVTKTALSTRWSLDDTKFLERARIKDGFENLECAFAPNGDLIIDI